MVDDINVIDKRYIYQLMSNVQLLGLKKIDSQILLHSCIQNNDVSLEKEFQNHISKDYRKHGVINQKIYI